MRVAGGLLFVYEPLGYVGLVGVQRGGGFLFLGVGRRPPRRPGTPRPPRSTRTLPGGPPGCATRDLKATVGVAQGAAGSVYQVIDFTNIGTASCSLYGYPGIALAGGSPVTQIGMAASRSPQAGPALVTLKPGAVANTLLRITEAQNYPTSKCSPMASTYLQIYPPNQTTPIYLGYKSTGCSATGVNLLTVSVVQSGAGSGN